MYFSVFLFVTELIATAAYAVSGVIAAKKRNLDLFGTVFTGVAAAVGGGVIRDLLLGNTPPVMFTKPVYALTAIPVSLIGFFIEKRSRLFEDEGVVTQILNAADTFGLGIFAVTGTHMAAFSEHGDNLFLALFVGMTTAVGGGILRDLLTGQIPLVLRKRIYAVAALVGAFLYYAFRIWLKMPLVLSELIVIAVVTLIRYLAIRYRWNLPAFEEKS